MDNVIIADKLSIELGKKKIIKDINLSVKKGEYISILGPNGSGKTTFLKTLSGIYEDYSGLLTVFDKEVNEYEKKELSLKISFVFQSLEINDFTVKDFVLLSRFPYLSPFDSYSKKDYAIVADVLEKTGTSDYADRIIHTLSGGERQRVMIASALCQDTDIILFDEPATYLDPHYQEQIHHLVHDINKNMGKTVIVVTHDINAASYYSDRIFIFKNGEILSDTEILSENILETAFEKKFYKIKHPQNASDLFI